MADLKIKATSGNLVLADDGGDAAITVASNGTTTFAESTDISAGVTLPAGHVRQVKFASLGEIATGSTDVYFPNSIQFDNAILSTSDVLLIATGTVICRYAHTDNNITLYFSSADGGSLGAGSSGTVFNFNLFSGLSIIHTRFSFAGTLLVTNPNSTTPTYRVYVDRVDTNSSTSACEVSWLTLMEIISS